MPLYSYKGFDATSGSSVKGKIEADNMKIARQKLKQGSSRILVSEITEEKARTYSLKDKSSPFTAFSALLAPKIKLNDLAIMTRQFATLQSAHVPIDESLRALVEQVENETLSKILAQVKDGLSEGKSLGDAMSKYPHCFNRLYVNMITAGESSGTLALVLERLADFLEYQSKIKSELISALMYPLIMILASLGIISYLFVSVVPKLQKVFSSLKVNLPTFTQMLIKTSEFLQNNLFGVFIGLAIIVIAFDRWRKSKKGRMLFDQFMLKVPLFGPIVVRVNVSRFTKTLSTLLNSGVPIVAALEITKNTIPNSIIAQVVNSAKTAVQEGQSLGATIEKSKKFPALVSHMIKTGEKTGELETMLSHVAKAYDVEVERKIAGMLTLIEPAMIILMGGVVVVVVIAMLVPMLGVMSQVR
ncbi:MAG: type II secretion system F family protein [Proteobacteria bacterium]|nr:type II secretion system F family protein [Pseudomonadota bacterium]